MYKLLITESQPNGCHSLIVVDTDTNQVVDSIDDAIFGCPIQDVVGWVDGDEFYPKLTEADALTEEEVADHEEWIFEQNALFEPSCFVRDLTKYVAVSPVSDGSEVEVFLKKYSNR
jgi:hypothetical protein